MKLADDKVAILELGLALDFDIVDRQQALHLW